jgi:hypothetical protein
LVVVAGFPFGLSLKVTLFRAVASTNTINMGIGAINLRLESIEDNQILLWTHKMPNKLPLKKAKTVPVKQAGIAMGELETKIEVGRIDEEK